MKTYISPRDLTSTLSTFNNAAGAAGAHPCRRFRGCHLAALNSVTVCVRDIGSHLTTHHTVLTCSHNVDIISTEVGTFVTRCWWMLRAAAAVSPPPRAAARRLLRVPLCVLVSWLQPATILRGVLQCTEKAHTALGLGHVGYDLCVSI